MNILMAIVLLATVGFVVWLSEKFSDDHITTMPEDDYNEHTDL